MQLKSAKISVLLLWSLRVFLVLTVIALGIALLEAWIPAQIAASVQNLLVFPGLIISLIPILALVWIYQLHRDLKQLYPGYPIDPWDALTRLVLPIYNIWGIWNTLTTLAHHFQQEGKILQDKGKTIRAFTILLYSLVIVLLISNRFLPDTRGDIVVYAPIVELPEAIIRNIRLVQQLVLPLVAYSLLAIAQATIEGVSVKANQLRQLEKRSGDEFA